MTAGKARAIHETLYLACIPGMRKSIHKGKKTPLSQCSQKDPWISSPKMKKYFLDKEEKEILKAIESGKWPMRKLTKSERERYAKAARNTLRKMMA